MQPKVFDLNTVVSDMEKMLRRMIGEDIELRVTRNADLGNIKADPVQLEQVVMNLVVNARDAMPKGGKLSIETANVVSRRNVIRRDHVSVVPRTLCHACDQRYRLRYGRGDTSANLRTVLHDEGAGEGDWLGLSMVYGIVKQSGGNIWVYSEEGHGTTFKIYFPE